MATLINEEFRQVALPKSTVAVAREDGRIYLVDFTEYPQLDDPTAIDWDVSVSKLLIGKVALSRNRMSTLEGVAFENIVHTENVPSGATTDTQISIFGSLDGKNNSIEVKPFVKEDFGGYMEASCRLTALNFSVQLRGTYNINTLQVILHPAGRR